MMKAHLSHAVREVTEVIYIIVTGPLAEFARVKASGIGLTSTDCQILYIYIVRYHVDVDIQRIYGVYASTEPNSTPKADRKR